VYENLELIGEPSKDHWPAHVAVKGLVGLTWNEPESWQDILVILVHLCGGGLENVCEAKRRRGMEYEAEVISRIVRF
jgi:hypothetical protein